MVHFLIFQDIRVQFDDPSQTIGVEMLSKCNTCCQRTTPRRRCKARKINDLTPPEYNLPLSTTQIL